MATCCSGWLARESQRGIERGEGGRAVEQIRGALEGIPAALGGHVMLYVSASEWKPQVDAGQMRLPFPGLAVAGTPMRKMLAECEFVSQYGWLGGTSHPKRRRAGEMVGKLALQRNGLREGEECPV